MNTIASCFLACLLALLMIESCFGVPMGQISINYDFLEPLDPAMVVYPNEPSMEYPVGHTGPDMNENIMGSRVRRSMVDYPMDPSMYPMDLSMYPLMEYPMGSDGHTEPDMDDNMMGSRSRRSPRKLSMVENPLEPPMEYPVLYPSMEYPMGPGEHTGPDMESNMMGARSRRSPREPCNQQTIPEILKCFERQG